MTHLNPSVSMKSSISSRELTPTISSAMHARTFISAYSLPERGEERYDNLYSHRCPRSSDMDVDSDSGSARLFPFPFPLPFACPAPLPLSHSPSTPDGRPPRRSACSRSDRGWLGITVLSAM